MAAGGDPRPSRRGEAVKFGLFGINVGAVCEPADRGKRRARGGARRLRVGLDGRARGVARSPGRPRRRCRRARRCSIRPSRSPSSPPTPSASGSGPASSSCRSETPWCWPRSWRASTCCPAGGCCSESARAISSRSSPPLGVSFAERGARCDEYLDAIVALWTQPQPRFAGKLRRVLGDRRAAASRAAPAPAHPRGRAEPGGVPPSRAARQRLVRLRARPRRDAPLPRRPRARA